MYICGISCNAHAEHAAITIVYFTQSIVLAHTETHALMLKSAKLYDHMRARGPISHSPSSLPHGGQAAHDEASENRYDCAPCVLCARSHETHNVRSTKHDASARAAWASHAMQLLTDAACCIHSL